MGIKFKGGGSGSSLDVPNDLIFANSTARDAYFTANPARLRDGVYVSNAGVLEKYDGGTLQFVPVTPIITGPKGTDASQVKFQYSVSGNSDWTEVLDTGVHKYWRWSTDNGNTWTPNFVRFKGEGGGAVPEPYSMNVSAEGRLQLLKSGKLIQEQDETGAWIAQSISTGTGSLHIGDLHSNGSAGENVLWLNTQSNICWFPAWQGINKSDATTYDLTTRKHSALLTSEPVGAVASVNAVSYTDTFTAPADVAFFRVDIVPAEAYKGRLTWESRFMPSNTEVAAFMFDVDLQIGIPYTIYLKYPLYVRLGQQVAVTIKKTDGNVLTVRPSITQGAKPWRKTYYTSYVDHLVYNQSDNALVARGLETLVEADALDVMKLKNVGLLSKGNYRGDIPTGLAGLTGSLKGDWWKASVARAIAGTNFAVGDELYCGANTPTLPTDLTNFSKVANVNQVMIASTQADIGQAGITPPPPAGDVKVLTNRGWGEPQYKDAVTSKKYILVIDNGLPYLEEVV